MNCFSHAYRFLNRDPYFVAGTCVPDWLTMVDRKVRARRKSALGLVAVSGSNAAVLAQGIVQHHDDDDVFHNNTTFVNLNLELAIEIRQMLEADAGFRPHLSGHILIEVLLDGFLALQDVSKLDRYYQLIAQVDAVELENGINQIAAKPTQKMKAFVPRFLNERYLYDYMNDAGVLYRLNRVLQRIKLTPLPERFLGWLPSIRKRVEDQISTLLPGFGY